MSRSEELDVVALAGGVLGVLLALESSLESLGTGFEQEPF